LNTKAQVITGESYEKELSRVPMFLSTYSPTDRDVPTPFGTWQTTALFDTHDVDWHFDAPTIPTGVESYEPKLVPESVTRVPPTVAPFVVAPT